jgi:hypothetical protein
LTKKKDKANFLKMKKVLLLVMVVVVVFLVLPVTVSWDLKGGTARVSSFVVPVHKSCLL